MLLVLLGGWLSSVTDVSRLCAPVIESHLSVLHVLVVSPFNSSPRSTRRPSHSTHRRILVVFHSAHSFAVLRFQLAWTCLPRSPLLPSKSWAVAVERDSPPSLSSVCDLIDCINLHGRVHDGRCRAGWHPHEQIKYVHVPFLSEH